VEKDIQNKKKRINETGKKRISGSVGNKTKHLFFIRRFNIYGGLGGDKWGHAGEPCTYKIAFLCSVKT
jgi:hypothetical protein